MGKQGPRANDNVCADNVISVNQSFFGQKPDAICISSTAHFGPSIVCRVFYIFRHDNLAEGT